MTDEQRTALARIIAPEVLSQVDRARALAAQSRQSAARWAAIDPSSTNHPEGPEVIAANLADIVTKAQNTAAEYEAQADSVVAPVLAKVDEVLAFVAANG